MRERRVSPEAGVAAVESHANTYATERERAAGARFLKVLGISIFLAAGTAAVLGPALLPFITKAALPYIKAAIAAGKKMWLPSLLVGAVGWMGENISKVASRRK